MDDVLRRRSVGAPAARSTLLTVLGEFLLARPEGAWQEALIGSLRALGFTPSAARQAVVKKLHRQVGYNFTRIAHTQIAIPREGAEVAHFDIP